jgi:glutamyl-tRNA reductase
MSIVVIGLNHTTASLALREQVYFALETLPLYLQDILHRRLATEAVLLSTCNRSELYCDTQDVSLVREWFYQQTLLPQKEMEAATYLYQDEKAISHMMEVASGLDSMILGEPQILGQMKQAFSESCTAGAVGALFHRLFQHIFMIAKKIRTTTAIGACPVSVASAAVHFAKQQLSALTGLNVLLIGAGETAELLLRYLSPHPTQSITLINRSLDKAKKLIKGTKVNAADFNYLPTALLTADLVFSATGSPLPIINQKLMEKVMEKRSAKPILLMDLAVPRDIEKKLANLVGVTLYDIDHLKDMIEENRRGREHAADKAREMIHEASIALMNEIISLASVTHTIRAYREHIETLCQFELNKAKQQLSQGGDPIDVLEVFAKAYTNKLLHSPSAQLRQAGVEGRFELLRFAKQLFAIPDIESDETLYTDQVTASD